MLTRRNAIVAGAGVLAVAGCGGRPVRKLAGSAADLPFLAAALELERALIAVYEAAPWSVTAADADLARLLLDHERAHAGAVAEAIGELGGRVHAPRARAVYERGLPRRDAAAWRSAAIVREEAAAAAYARAIPKLANGRLRATFAAIMTTEAEHAAALDLR